MMKKGFTLIELMLAMAFVSILIIAIAILVMNIQGIYRRGIAMREVNSTSRAIVDDLTRSINSAPAVVAGTHAVRFTNGARIEGGAFCTGFYSYVWRQADFLLNGPFTGGVRINDSQDYRLLKMRDVGRLLCNPTNLQNAGLSGCNVTGGRLTCPVSGIHNLTSAAFGFGAPVELISSGGMELALFDFDVFEPARSGVTGHVFYSGSFILGTPRGARTDASGALFSTDVCQPPADADRFDFQYCSINKFNFAASSLGAIGER